MYETASLEWNFCFCSFDGAIRLHRARYTSAPQCRFWVAQRFQRCDEHAYTRGISPCLNRALRTSLPT